MSPTPATPLAPASPTRGLAAPTVLEWLRELAGVVGPQEALAQWAAAASATGHHGTDLDLRRLEEVGRRLAAAPGDPLVGIVARSCLARLSAYRVLSTGSTR